MGVHWEMELYFWSTRQTRLDLFEVGEVEEEDSRELRGRIRIATMMPSSVPLLGVLVSVGEEEEEEGASLLDIVLSVKRSISIDRMLLLFVISAGFKTNAASAYDCSSAVNAFIKAIVALS